MKSREFQTKDQECKEPKSRLSEDGGGAGRVVSPEHSGRGSQHELGEGMGVQAT